ncbi:META domain-containing protein [Deinococcus sp. 14RED07]|uniref:META domain-containing protein n=1 Tax=Deinococcus sp. 14RED07 TaxID=2745874 RepID=UPI001E5CEBBA|nr:META domain-containing protein [Deinococcus sp. 14RED07]MCD0177201.1 META domain-containing protein [Deinococcus sp. 14RED07]
MKKFTLALLLLGTGTAQIALSPDLNGSWKIVGWTLPDAVPVKNRLPQLNIQGDRLTGTTGCNRLNGTLRLNGNSVTFSAINTTRMACPEAVTAQEQALLKALSGRTLTATRVQDSLTLDTGAGMLNIRRMTVQTP